MLTSFDRLHCEGGNECVHVSAVALFDVLSEVSFLGVVFLGLVPGPTYVAVKVLTWYRLGSQDCRPGTWHVASPFWIPVNFCLFHHFGEISPSTQKGEIASRETRGDC